MSLSPSHARFTSGLCFGMGNKRSADVWFVFWYEKKKWFLELVNNVYTRIWFVFWLRKIKFMYIPYSTHERTPR